MSTPTPNQRRAIESRGNLLIVAGAGAGKTQTLVQRCVSFLLDDKRPGSLDELLMVTFTEAAAAEMRRRIRAALHERFELEPENLHLAEQLALLDSAPICTLHSFCFQLVRDYFYHLDLDPRLNILPEEHAKLLARDVLDQLMRNIYEGKSPLAEPVQQLVSEQGRGWDKPIRELVERIHAYTQTIQNPAHWFSRQLETLKQNRAEHWERWFAEAMGEWSLGWQAVLDTQDPKNSVAHACSRTLQRLPENPTRADASEILREILAADNESNFPHGSKGRFRDPIKKLFEEAEFLASLCSTEGEPDPLTQDWEWIKPQTMALLQLAREFSEKFSEAKRESGGLDFHDLEQFALKLLWNNETNQPTDIAQRWREKLRLVLVDEYQDINEAQDTILRALGREGNEPNRFLVGDVKQSIYRFRLADPRIFLSYQTNWATAAFSKVIPLADNFRSHEAILNFVNPLFTSIMKREIGGVEYDESARLQFGNREGRKHLTVAEDSSARVELHLRQTGGDEELLAEWDALSNTEKEARLIAARLLEMKKQGVFVWKEGKEQALEWNDVVILLRSPRHKTEAFAKEFRRAGIPLTTTRTGFYESLEVTDVLSLLKLLDNPLQDAPLLAVLRSPFVGLSLDELAEIRVVQRQGKFWTALGRWREQNATVVGVEKTFLKVDRFLQRFRDWRRAKRQWSLSRLTETLLDETYYLEWLSAQDRGEQRRANVERLLDLARRFDSLQGQGLFRFIRFIESQQEAEIDLEPASVEVGNAVRLMSIHQSKGLEFPVVIVADLGKAFNFSDGRGKMLLDEEYGLCPQVMPPGTRQTYPSLPYWLAQRRQKKATLGEELRLLYVALTRAADRLLLFGTASRTAFEDKWNPASRLGVQEISGAKNYLEWICPWIAQTDDLSSSGQNALLNWTTYFENDSRLNPSLEVIAEPDSIANASVSAAEMAELETRINWDYQFAAATIESAKTSVSALRRRDVADEEAHLLWPIRSKTRAAPGKLSASDIGTAHHTFLEFVDLEKTGSTSELVVEAERLREAGTLTAEEVAALNLHSIVAFWESEVGRQIFRNANYIHREHPFTSRLNMEDFARLKFASPTFAVADEFVVLQGVIDIAVILPEEIWLLDFKTDQEERIDRYCQQVELYADALQKIYRKPVTRRWLHFLALNKTASVPADQSSAS